MNFDFLKKRQNIQVDPDFLSRKSKVQNGSKDLVLALQKTEQELELAASEEVLFTEPLIYLSETPVIKKGTINIVQGKFGSHKSRILEIIAGLLLAHNPSPEDYIGFGKDLSSKCLVAYVDTERNLKEELPSAIQSVRLKAGFGKTQKVDRFRFNSLKQFERKDRLDALKVFINSVKEENTDHHLVVILDVVTDCVKTFNRDDESLMLFDFLGNLCEEYEVTFILAIHENFGTEKARGHVGSEATNKASTVMQIGFEKNKSGDDTEIIKLKFIKLRRARKPEPIYLQYSTLTNSLVKLDTEFVNQMLPEKGEVAPLDQVIDEIERHLIVEKDQKELLQLLKGVFECSENTLRNRMRTIVEKESILYDGDGCECHLKVIEKKGTKTKYSLCRIIDQKVSQPNQSPI